MVEYAVAVHIAVLADGHHIALARDEQASVVARGAAGLVSGNVPSVIDLVMPVWSRQLILLVWTVKNDSLNGLLVEVIVLVTLQVDPVVFWFEVVVEVPFHTVVVIS